MPTHDTPSSEKIAGVTISISREHHDFEKDISECFDNAFPTDSGLMRFSNAELALQVIIGVASWVGSNIVWDILKSGVKKFFTKFPKGGLVISHEGIMFIIRIDGSVHPVVVPELEVNYSTIKTIEDLIKHIESSSEAKDESQSEWRETTLGEVSNFISRGVTPKYTEKGIRVYNQKCIRDGNILLRDSRFLDEKQGIMDEKILKDYDILICSTGVGTLGRVGQIKELKEKSTVDTHVTIVRINESNSKEFFGYLLKSKEKFIESLAEGSTGQTELPREKVRNIPILLPPLPEQRAIADMLSSLDAKIELLREQNETLEKTAQTIFHEWFGRYSVESPEELPEGWRVGKLGQEFDITIGRTPPRAESEWFSDIPTGMKWISIKDIGNSGTFIFDTSEYLTDEAVRKFNVPVIPKNTTILSFKMTVGKLTITTEEMLSNEAIAHMKIKKSSYLTSEYIYLWLQSLDFNSLGSTSSIVTAINSTMIKDINFIIPSEEVLGKFMAHVLPIFYKTYNNSIQIQSLSKTRDILLPKLMSGEARIPIN